MCVREKEGERKMQAALQHSGDITAFELSKPFSDEVF